METAELTKKISALEEQSKTLLADAKKAQEADDSEGLKSIQSDLTDVVKALEPLQVEHEKAVRAEEFKSMQGQVETLTAAVESMREPDLMGGATGGSEQKAETTYGAKGQFSYFNDLKLAAKGNSDAEKRLNESVGEKAMTEGNDSAGGYLVPTQEIGGLIGMRENASILRPLFSSINVTRDSIQVQMQTSGLVAGWVAEMAEKPIGDLSFGEVTASVFTAAGLAIASNQLLADAQYSIDQLVFMDLAKRLAALEEIAFLNGTGVGQPRGILNTPGVETINPAANTVVALLDAIQQAITDIYTDYKGAPSAIVMHPQEWGRIVSAREASAPSTYLVGAGASPWGRRANDPLPGYGQSGLPRGELFGLPVYTTASVPRTLGASDNGTAVFVANWKEGLILDREGIQNDTSDQVLFTSNQTIFRSEERVGFTAARFPEAFKVVAGANLPA